jgi:hypothetical protein
MVPPARSSPRRDVLAVTTAEKFAIDPPDVRIPCDSGGKEKMSHSQRVTFASSRTSAGAGAARFTNRFVTHASRSATAAE